MNNKIADLVMAQQPGHVIREQAIKSGMFSLIHDGLIKAQRGDTSLQEILETLGSERE
jgi:type II secretory ATPase GspE/PulE/Tfp pilus assembly ATPase PilB-like protein